MKMSASNTHTIQSAWKSLRSAWARQLYKNISMLFLFPVKDGKLSTGTARVLASQAEAIVDLRRTWPQHRIDIH